MTRTGDQSVEPLRVRRSLLEHLAVSWRPPLQLMPLTADLAEAQRWLEEYVAADVGVEGLVAKGANQKSCRSGGYGRTRNTRHGGYGVSRLKYWLALFWVNA